MTDDLIDLREMDDLYNNVTFANPVQQTPRLADEPRLPSGVDGNQFIYAKFSGPLDIASILSDRPADQSNSGLTGAIVVEAVDAFNGTATYVDGQAFINGKTYAGSPVGDPPRLALQTWVTLEDGVPIRLQSQLHRARDLARGLRERGAARRRARRGE